MKKINIPTSFGHPTVKVSINSKDYQLETGKDIEVEDFIADFIEDAIKSQEPEMAPSTPSGGKFVVYIMEDDNGNLVFDKTFEEIDAAMETQTVVLDFFGVELRHEGGVQGRNHHFAGVDFVGLPVIVCYRVKITHLGAVEVSEEGYDLSSLKM